MFTPSSVYPRRQFVGLQNGKILKVKWHSQGSRWHPKRKFSLTESGPLHVVFHLHDKIWHVKKPSNQDQPLKFRSFL